MSAYTMNDAERALVDALRSGTYRQGAGFLRLGDRYCCLGVACDVLGMRWRKYNDDGVWAIGDVIGVLPSTARRALGWRDADGGLRVRNRDGIQLTLADLNDAGFTLAQIADVIAAGLVLHEGEELS